MRNNEFSAGERGRGGVRGEGGGRGEGRRPPQHQKGSRLLQLEKLLEGGDVWRATLGSQNFSHSGAASENNGARAPPPALHLEGARGRSREEVPFLHFPPPLCHVRLETSAGCVSKVGLCEGRRLVSERKARRDLSLGTVFLLPLKWLLPFYEGCRTQGEGLRVVPGVKSATDLFSL